MPTEKKVAGYAGILNYLRSEKGYTGTDDVDEVVAFGEETEGVTLPAKSKLIRAYKEMVAADVTQKPGGGIVIEIDPSAEKMEEDEDAEKEGEYEEEGEKSFATSPEAYRITKKQIQELQGEVRSLKRGNVATGGNLNIPGRKSYERRAKSGQTAFSTPEAAVAFWSERVAKSQGMKAKHPGLHEKAVKRLEQLGIKAGNTGPGFNGSATLASEYIDDLINLRDEYGTMANELRSYTVEKDRLERSRLTGDLLSSVYHPDENETWDKTNNKYDKVTTNPKRDAIMVKMSKDLLQLSELDQAEEAVRESRRALGYAEDQAIVNGDGSSTYGGRVGLKQGFANLGITGSAGTDKTYAYVGGADWDAHTYDYINNWMSLLPAYVYQTGNPKIYCSKKFQISVLNRLANEAGGVTLTERRNGEITINSFGGYEVVTSEVFNRDSANGSNIVDAYFGDLSLAGMIHYTRPMDIEFSDQVFFDSDDVALRAINRYDSLFHDLGSSSAAGPVVALIQAA